MTVGDKIKARRKELGLNAEELGARIGKDRSSIYRYEKGDIEGVPFDVLKQIAIALDTTPQELLEWKEPPEEKLSETIRQTIDLVKTCPAAKEKRLYRMISLFLEED